MSSASKRREIDLTKLMMNDYRVELINDSLQEFYVEFHGPNDCPYQGGVWKVKVTLPDTYPFTHPSIFFVNKIFHPNIAENSGSVCLDVIREGWSAMFDLVNVFEVFLPQLLLYPNPSSWLNCEAADLMKRDETSYVQKVKEYCEKYAKPKDIEVGTQEDPNDEELSDDHDSSSDSEIDDNADP